MMDIDRRSEEVLSVYFEWLVSLVGEEWWGHTYRSLLRRFFDLEYYWTIPMDENRAEDGKMLREEFWNIFPSFYRDEVFVGPCVVLEALIGMARRVEFEVDDRPLEAIFWRMVDNLGLLGMDDEVVCEHYQAVIGEILRCWMSGLEPWTSPFWHENPNFEPLETELWYQMHGFLGKNPDFG